MDKNIFDKISSVSTNNNTQEQGGVSNIFSKIQNVSLNGTQDTTSIFNKIDSIKTGTEKKSVGGIIKDYLIKPIVEPVATMVARPIQLGAELLGAKDEDVNAFTKRIFGDWIAETPQNAQDVYKDIGRGIQTALTGGLGSVAKEAIVLAKAGKTAQALTKLGVSSAEGAGFGLGASMEHGNKILSKETAQSVGLGAGVGLALPVAGKLVGKTVSKLTTKATPELTKVADESIIKATQEGKMSKEIPEFETTKPIEQIKQTTQQTIKTETPTPTSNDNIQKIISNEIEKGTARDMEKFTNLSQEQMINNVKSHPLDEIVDIVTTGKQPEDAPLTAYRAFLSNHIEELRKVGKLSESEDLINKVSRVTAKIKGESGQALNANKIASKDNLVDMMSDIRQAKIEEMSSSVKKTVKGLDEKIKKLTDDIFDYSEKGLDKKPTADLLESLLKFIEC